MKKTTDFYYFWYTTTSRRNLTMEGYKLAHLTYKMLSDYLGSAKSD